MNKRRILYQWPFNMQSDCYVLAFILCMIYDRKCKKQNSVRVAPGTTKGHEMEKKENPTPFPRDWAVYRLIDWYKILTKIRQDQLLEHFSVRSAPNKEGKSYLIPNLFLPITVVYLYFSFNLQIKRGDAYLNRFVELKLLHLFTEKVIFLNSV